MDPTLDIPDSKLLHCRRCRVAGCDTCLPRQDVCAVCKPGFDLVEGGQCRSSLRFIWYGFYGLAVLVVAFLAGWYLDLRRRPTGSRLMLGRALLHRARSMIRDCREGHAYFPLTTNLHQVPIAGPGVLLHFDFQVAVMVWVGCVILGWLALGGVFRCREILLQNIVTSNKILSLI